MKLKALASLCQEAKTVRLYDAEDGTQWAGTCWAIWRLPENLGTLSEDALCAIFDISEEKKAKMRIERERLPESYDSDDNSPGERDLLFNFGRRLMLDGRDLLPLKAPGGETICVRMDDLKPGKDAEQPGFCLRARAEEGPYIVFKDGMFVLAIITPRVIAPDQMTWLGDVIGGMSVE